MATLDVESVDSQLSRVVNEKVYVAVGREFERSKLTLQWALGNFGGDFRILYVHNPAKTNPAASQFYEGDESDDSRSSEEIKSENVNKLLDEYVQMCSLAKVTVEKIWIEEKDTAKGIVELIELHAITKLVMGAAADFYYTDNMWEICSTKASFVEQHAHPSCSIWFVCKGNFIHFREGDLRMIDMDVGSSWQPAQFTVETRPSNLESSYSSEEDDDQPLFRRDRGEGSSHTTQPIFSPSYEHTLMNVLDGNSNDDFDEQLDKAMTEAENAKREAFEELIRRHKAEKNAIEATRRAKLYENLCSEEQRRRKEVEEIQRVLLDSHIAASYYVQQKLRDNKKERDELQVQLESALKVNEELLTNQSGEPSASSSHSHGPLMEFSFSDIQEATDSFNPALKIEEDDYGNLFKGSLHCISVSIKMLQSPSHYHQEVQVVNRLRHPNLINLIGVCPDACALIYEHLPSGNLEDLLTKNISAPLPWKKRIKISTEICTALIFLHSSNPLGTVHGDLKPKNVLLDANLVSKLKDFGIHGQSDLKTMESDVFYFGIILMRLLTGKSDHDLATKVQDAVNKGNLNTMLDSTAGEWPFVEATQLAHLALSCCDMDQDNRPDLRSEVWAVLESVRASGEEVSPNNGINSNQPPAHFVCPIQHDVMEDPVVAADGFSYEAEAIQEWFDNGHDTSPMTNLQLAHKILIPNQTLRSIIQEWMENQ